MGVWVVLVSDSQPLDGQEFEQALGNSEGQGSLVRCSLWGRRVGHDLVSEQQPSRYLLTKQLWQACGWHERAPGGRGDSGRRAEV